MAMASCTPSVLHFYPSVKWDNNSIYLIGLLLNDIVNVKSSTEGLVLI